MTVTGKATLIENDENEWEYESINAAGENRLRRSKGFSRLPPSVRRFSSVLSLTLLYNG